MIALLHNAYVHKIAVGAATGAVGAGVADLHAVTQFKNWNQLVTYDWGTATFRWFSGALSGAATAAGLGVFV